MSVVFADETQFESVKNSFFKEDGILSDIKSVQFNQLSQVKTGDKFLVVSIPDEDKFNKFVKNVRKYKSSSDFDEFISFNLLFNNRTMSNVSFVSVDDVFSRIDQKKSLKNRLYKISKDDGFKNDFDLMEYTAFDKNKMFINESYKKILITGDKAVLLRDSLVSRLVELFQKGSEPVYPKMTNHNGKDIALVHPKPQDLIDIISRSYVKRNESSTSDSEESFANPS